MTKLTAATPELLGHDEPGWRRAQRDGALARFGELGLPDTEDEVWHYAPLSRLKLAELDLVDAPLAVALDALPDGVRVAGVDEDWVATALGGLVGPADAFAALNLAFAAPLVLDVAAGVRVASPLRATLQGAGGAGFPRLLVRLGRGSSLRVLERVGGTAGLLAGVAEFEVGDDARLEVVSVQDLDDDSWSIGRTRARLGRGAAFTQVVVGLGAHYDRVRADALLEGEGAESTLHTAHVGTGTQVHDLRTQQVHVGARTTSRLYSKAAVAGQAESIYSGLISMRHGARKADARQANQSLVLSDGARADAVPNLDIEENDVRCSHASSVGPVDEEQRWYLESRGVEPDEAVRLIVEGFFAEVEALLESDAAAVLRERVGRLELTGGTR